MSQGVCNPPATGTSGELPFVEPDPGAFAALVELLPVGTVTVCAGPRGAKSPWVLSLAKDALREALARGYTVDRTNGDGPMAEWDGWLIILRPKVALYLQIRAPGGGVLNP